MSRSERLRAGSAGFTYIECLAALTIIGLAIVAADAVFVARPAIETRLEAAAEATRALELAVESVRAGVIPARPGEQAVLLPEGSAAAAADLDVTLRTRALEPAGLFEVRARARWRAAGRAHAQELVTLVWRRP